MDFNVDTLIPEIRVGGEFFDAERAAARGWELTCTVETTREGSFLTLAVKNRSDAPFRLEKFNWHRCGEPRDFLRREGLKVYLEGWQMATPCGVRTFGDRDFRFNPEYLKFAVCDPEDYSPEPNRFRAENAVMFHDDAGGETLLFGFVTSGRQFGHFKLELDAGGVKTFDARSACDGMLVEPGDTVASECLAVLAGDDGFELLRRFAGIWGDRMGARTEMPPPVGWCSWYYYFENVTEDDIRENAEYAAARRDRFPLRYIQLDDGYQSALGDWLRCNEKFPHGLSGLAASVRKAGFIPALWLGPFMAEENSELGRRHPDWLIHDADGAVLWAFNWRGNHKVAVLDGTHPEVQQHFRTLFAELRKSGFDYVKLDFMMLASSLRNGVLHDPKATRAQALRRGLEAIREGFGEDGFILGCTAPFGPQVGLADGERISTDITPYWGREGDFDEAPSVPNVCRNVIRHTYMNRKLWNNDPDTLIVRSDNTELNAEEVALWYQAVRLAGGMLMLSDRFSTLAPERVRMLTDLLRSPDAFFTRPEDFWTTGIPSVWRGDARRGGASETRLFNFTDAERSAEGVVLPPHVCRIKR